MVRSAHAQPHHAQHRRARQLLPRHARGARDGQRVHQPCAVGPLHHRDGAQATGLLDVRLLPGPVERLRRLHRRHLAHRDPNELRRRRRRRRRLGAAHLPPAACPQAGALALGAAPDHRDGALLAFADHEPLHDPLPRHVHLRAPRHGDVPGHLHGGQGLRPDAAQPRGGPCAARRDGARAVRALRQLLLFDRDHLRGHLGRELERRLLHGLPGHRLAGDHLLPAARHHRQLHDAQPLHRHPARQLRGRRQRARRQRPCQRDPQSRAQAPR